MACLRLNGAAVDAYAHDGTHSTTAVTYVPRRRRVCTGLCQPFARDGARDGFASGVPYVLLLGKVDKICWFNHFNDIE